MGCQEYRSIYFHIRFLTGVVTLLPWHYNFLDIRMGCNTNPEDQAPANTPMKDLQRLGLFEENLSNAPGASPRFSGLKF